MKRWGWPITLKRERNAAESIDHERVLKKENVEDHKQSTKRRRRLKLYYIHLEEKYMRTDKARGLHGLTRSAKKKCEEFTWIKEGFN